MVDGEGGIGSGDEVEREDEWAVPKFVGLLVGVVVFGAEAIDLQKDGAVIGDAEWAGKGDAGDGMGEAIVESGCSYEGKTNESGMRVLGRDKCEW